MDMNGTCDIAAPRADVWAALNDPEILRQCIPGCDAITILSSGEWDITALTKIGPIKARFNGRLAFSDIDPPNGCVITGTGNGGVAGFATGSAEVNLEDAGPGTRLKYAVRSKVGGRIAQIGSRLLESSARKQIDQFFAQFKDVLTGSQPDIVAKQPAPAPAADTVGMPATLNQAPAPVSEATQAGTVMPRLQLILTVAILFGVAACLFGISTCLALVLVLLHVGL